MSCMELSMLSIVQPGVTSSFNVVSRTVIPLLLLLRDETEPRYSYSFVF